MQKPYCKLCIYKLVFNNQETTFKGPESKEFYEVLNKLNVPVCITYVDNLEEINTVVELEKILQEAKEDSYKTDEQLMKEGKY